MVQVLDGGRWCFGARVDQHPAIGLPIAPQAEHAQRVTAFQHHPGHAVPAALVRHAAQLNHLCVAGGYVGMHPGQRALRAVERHGQAVAMRTGGRGLQVQRHGGAFALEHGLQRPQVQL